VKRWIAPGRNMLGALKGRASSAFSVRPFTRAHITRPRSLESVPAPDTLDERHAGIARYEGLCNRQRELVGLLGVVEPLTFRARRYAEAVESRCNSLPTQGRRPRSASRSASTISANFARVHPIALRPTERTFCTPSSSRHSPQNALPDHATRTEQDDLHDVSLSRAMSLARNP